MIGIFREKNENKTDEDYDGKIIIIVFCLANDPSLGMIVLDATYIINNTNNFRNVLWAHDLEDENDGDDRDRR